MASSWISWIVFGPFWSSLDRQCFLSTALEETDATEDLQFGVFCAETNSPFCDGFTLFYSVLLSPFDTRHARSRTTSPLPLCSVRFHTPICLRKRASRLSGPLRPDDAAVRTWPWWQSHAFCPRGRAFGPPSLASRYRFEALTTQGGNVLTQPLSSFLSFFFLRSVVDSVAAVSDRARGPRGQATCALCIYLITAAEAFYLYT